MTATIREQKRGLVGRSDLIQFLPVGDVSLEEFAGVAGALGFELCHEKSKEIPEEQKPQENAQSDTQGLNDQPQNGWTTFDPAPTQYWRVTGFHSKLSEHSSEDSSQRDTEQLVRGRSSAEIVKEAAFDPSKSLPFQPLAARNYLLTKLRAIAPTRSSASQLDIPKAVDRISRGEFLTSVPRKHRRVWGQNICVIQDRARRLVPYWLDEDQVTQIVAEVYPECNIEVARLHDGHSQPEYCFPTSLVGLDWQPPASGTLVLALTDLGALERDDKEHHERIWLSIGDLLRENGNPAIVLLPSHTNTLPDSLQQRWRPIHWQPSCQQTGSEAMDLKLDRLLQFLAPCIRLEPQLLRAVRLLTREFQSNPELESLIWQHPLLNSQHSVAGPVNPAVRESLLATFANLDKGLRRRILETLLTARQSLHPAVHFEELVSLDEDSRGIVNAELLELAEAYYCSLAEAGDDQLNAGILAWIDRCARRLPKKSRLPARLSQAMLNLVKKTQISDISDAPRWMVDAIRTAAKAKSEIRLSQRGGALILSRPHAELVPETHQEIMQTKSGGSLLGVVRCWEPVVWIHESEPDVEQPNEAQFWTTGKQPSWVHCYGTDRHGPWCSFRVKDVEQKLRWIPPGEFLMGSPKTENGREQNEGPQHRVIFKNGFWIFDTPCTQSLWFAVTGESPSKFKGNHRPVESIAWAEAISFSTDLRKHVDGLNLTLPSEAQWEYACRGVDSMPDDSRYGALDEVAWYSGNSGGQTHDVGQKKANSFGLYDTLGNVLEWCGDDAFRQYGRAAQTDPFYSKKGESNDKIVRGSDWSGYPRTTRAAYRGSRSATIRSSRVGFRLIGGNDNGSHPRSNMFCRRKQDDDAVQFFWWKPRESRNSDLQGVQQSETPELLAPVQNEPLRRVVRIPRTKSIRMESDCEVLSLDLSPPPSWAVASGRDRFGLWAEFELNGVRQRLRWIPPGQFLMGSANKPEYSRIDEQPQHSVTLTHGFWMFDTPCTQQLWNVSGIGAEFHFAGNRRPVESVSFEQVKDFVDQINSKVTDLHLRLPTESEWEYCCRAGSTGDRYGELDDIAWYSSNSEGQTQDVKQKQPNAWGLHDMLGNVWEWCLDEPRDYSKFLLTNHLVQAARCVPFVADAGSCQPGCSCGVSQFVPFGASVQQPWLSLPEFTGAQPGTNPRGGDERQQIAA